MNSINNNNKDFRSTFFAIKQNSHGQSKEKSEENENESTKKKEKALSKNKNYGSKNNLEKAEEESLLPKISANTNLSSVMENYKKTFYNKKFSNDINLMQLQNKKLP